MSGLQQHGRKRREPEDLIQDLLNVSLSTPAKKLRVSMNLQELRESPSSTLGSNFTPTSVLETPWGHSPTNPALSTPVPSTRSLPSQPVVRDEKALVLYRPVTPPMFPGGPPVGSVEFPYSVNASMLPSQGTESELTSHQLDCDFAFSNDTDSVVGPGLFQALDLSGGPVSYFRQKRLNRVSSCSSLPSFAVDNEDQVMVEEIDKSADLSVIPWVPMTPVVAPQVRPIIEEADDEAPDVDDDDDAMMDGDNMDVVNENQVIVTEDSMKPMAGQFGSPMPSFSAAPWQNDVAQQPFTTPMWSH